MLPRNDPGRIYVAFDDHRPVANAGVILLVTLAHHLGLGELVDRHIDLGDAPGRANAGNKFLHRHTTPGRLKATKTRLGPFTAEIRPPHAQLTNQSRPSIRNAARTASSWRRRRPPPADRVTGAHGPQTSCCLTLRQ